jgi:hypothetical protein
MGNGQYCAPTVERGDLRSGFDSLMEDMRLKCIQKYSNGREIDYVWNYLKNLEHKCPDYTPSKFYFWNSCANKAMRKTHGKKWRYNLRDCIMHSGDSMDLLAADIKRFREDREEARAHNITAVPSTVIGGEIYHGLPKVALVADAICQRTFGNTAFCKAKELNEENSKTKRDDEGIKLAISFTASWAVFLLVVFVPGFSYILQRQYKQLYELIRERHEIKG